MATAAIIHGKTYEPVARQKAESIIHKKIKICGLVINMAYPELAASPDGFIENDTLVEIKCPYTIRNEEIKGLAFLENVNGEWQLKKEHPYFYQVQGSMLITGRKRCVFVVYTFKELKCINVTFDENWTKMSLVPKLYAFWKSHYLPFLCKKLANAC